ncbi:MAG TPA: hypothetical protein VK169_05880 [Saprospiraceae bacterium]|nr:hypothetical protein [Saprospiraceae bacterium]
MFVILISFSCSNPGENRDTRTSRPEYFNEFNIGDVQYNQKVEFPKYGMGTYNSYVLLLEPYKGVHLTSNFNDEQSEIFWDLPGITEFTITENRITFQMMKDVFTIDVSDVNAPILISKVTTNTLDLNSLSPYKLNGSFECVDPSKGYIKNWIVEDVFDPKCWK